MKVEDHRPNVAAAQDIQARERRSVANTLRVRSEALLGPRGEIVIEHAGREYRLRQTRSGKLILTA
jgi:hemin uptake protein HemP